MSEFESTEGLETTGAQTGRKGKAKQAMGEAGEKLKQEAQSFASVAQERARAATLKRTETASRTLTDFAQAIRKAGDELAQTNQSPVARLVVQAADGLEGFASNLAGKQPEDLLNAVRDFGRRNPAAFIGGAVLVGVALGRFARAGETSGAGTIEPDVAPPAYPLADSGAAMGGAGLGAAAVGDEAMAEGLDAAEEDGFDGAPERGDSLATPVTDDLGAVRGADIGPSGSVLGSDVDEQPPGEGITDPTRQGS